MKSFPKDILLLCIDDSEIDKVAQTIRCACGAHPNILDYLFIIET